MREELLADILDEVSLAEQMADNPRLKKLLNCYNREAAVSGELVIIEITETGLTLKEGLKQLSPRSQLRILSKYHDTIRDVEGMERENHRFRLINRIITWVLGMFTLVIIASITLLFLSTFYEKEIPGMDFVKSTLDILFEIFKLVFQF